MNNNIIYVVNCTHKQTGKLFKSWHKDKDEAVKSAKENRSRKVWGKVFITTEIDRKGKVWN